MSSTLKAQHGYVAISRSNWLTRLITASLLFAVLLAGQASADTIRALVDLRTAKALFEQNRFSDADRLLKEVYTTLHPTANLDPERFIQVLDLVGQTKSSLGQHAEVVILMQERLQLAMFHYGDDSDEMAPAMAGLAEAFYRAGDNRRAIQFANEARFRFVAAGSAPDDYLELVENNLNKYRLRRFENAELPVDLSEFYTRCEAIRRGSLPSDVDMIMERFVEVGVDFHPDGFWGQMYQIAAMGPKGNLRSGAKYRRLFLPAADDATRTNLCVVDQTNGRVVSAESTID